MGACSARTQQPLLSPPIGAVSPAAPFADWPLTGLGATSVSPERREDAKCVGGSRNQRGERKEERGESRYRAYTVGFARREEKREERADIVLTLLVLREGRREERREQISCIHCWLCASAAVLHCTSPTFFFFFTLVTGPSRSLSLELSDTRVYEPQIRARLSNCNFHTHESPVPSPLPPVAEWPGAQGWVLPLGVLHQ